MQSTARQQLRANLCTVNLGEADNAAKFRVNDAQRCIYATIDRYGTIKNIFFQIWSLIACWFLEMISSSWSRIRTPDADPDPGCKFNADPQGSGSETLSDSMSMYGTHPCPRLYLLSVSVSASLVVSLSMSVSMSMPGVAFIPMPGVHINIRFHVHVRVLVSFATFNPLFLSPRWKKN
jgi:hypothetical protein